MASKKTGPATTPFRNTDSGNLISTTFGGQDGESGAGRVVPCPGGFGGGIDGSISASPEKPRYAGDEGTATDGSAQGPSDERDAERMRGIAAYFGRPVYRGDGA